MKKFYGIVIMILFVQFAFAQKISDPQLIAPENEMVNTMPNVTLDWSAVSGVGEITYHLQVATDQAFNNIVIDENGIDISAYYSEELLFGQQYFWKVKAIDDNGASNWSAVSSFSVFSMVDPKEPGDGDDEVSIRAMIEWDDEIEDVELTGGFSGVQIELDTAMTFDSPLYVMLEAEGVVFEKLSDYLLFGTTYYWRARPFHSNGVGEWCEVQMFETLFGTELKKPNNNASGEEFDVELKWDDIEENDEIFEYIVEVSTDESFTEPVTLITHETEINPDFLRFDTEYWWRVKVSHVNDVSTWTEARSFSTVANIELVAPEDGDVVNTVRPILEWNSIASVDGYQVIFSQSADYSNPTYYIVEGEDGDSYPLPSLDKNSDYYWSVRAYRSTDTSAWADQYHFNIPDNVGVEEISILEDVNIYPNPATTYLNVTFNVRQATELSWIITDVLGQNITEDLLQVQTGLFSKDISVADLNKGIYFLEITQGESKKVLKFVVK